MEMERESEMKRGRQIEMGEEAGRKKVAGQTKTNPEPSWMLTEMMAQVDKLRVTRELRLKSLVARLNKENPDAEPIVVEALTEEQRALLLQQEEKRRAEAAEQRYFAAELAHQEETARQPPPPPEDPDQDVSDRDYSFYRRLWERKRAFSRRGCYDSFDDTTAIPAMCFTDNPSRYTHHDTTMHIFAVKVTEIAADLRWPLAVYGMVAVRDRLDYRRNIIFNRTRDNCQTLNEQDPYLVLTGPTRAVVYDRYVYFDAALKVKGPTESEDKDLSLVFERYDCCDKINLCVSEGDIMLKSCVSSRQYTSKLSTLEFTCGQVVSSVEATITTQIVKGSWPDGSRGQFTAFIPSVGHMKVLLLDSGEGKAPVVATDGTVKLSRRVVSAESFGQLIVRAVVCRDGNQVAESKVSFAPLEAGRSHGMLDLGDCKLEVTVAWSLLLMGYPCDGFPPSKGSGEGAAGSSRS